MPVESLKLVRASDAKRIVPISLEARGAIGCAVVMGAGTNVVETSYSLLPALAVPFMRLQATPGMG